MERLDFTDDLPDKRDDARFRRHNPFFRSLREDTLPIVDHINVTASQDQFLDVMLKYRCRILFTPRSGYENHISLEVGGQLWQHLYPAKFLCWSEGFHWLLLFLGVVDFWEKIVYIKYILCVAMRFLLA